MSSDLRPLLAPVALPRHLPRAHRSDLRVFFYRCPDHQLAPLIAQRNDLELYLVWLPDVR